MPPVAHNSLAVTALIALSRSLISRCSVEASPCTGAALLGLALSATSVPAALAVITLLRLSLPASMLGTSSAAEVGQYPAPALLLVATVLGPLYELLVFQFLPIELLRRVGAGFAACVGISTLLFGAAHYWNGGLAHGVTSLTLGLPLAYGYALCRPYGWRPACLVVFTAHAVHNAILVALGLVFPELARA